MKHENRDENSILELISAGAAGSCRLMARRGVSLGIGDDAALFRQKPGYETILTCDWFLEGTHFLRESILRTLLVGNASPERSVT